MNYKSLITNFGRSWRQHTALQVATCAVLMGSFTIICLGMLAHHNLNQILIRWGDSIEMTVFLEDSISEDQKVAINRELENSKTFSLINYVSKESAAQKFTKQMKNLAPNLLNDKEFGNPLPASYELSLASRLNSKVELSALESLIKKIQNIEGVDEVSYGQGWVENYAALVSGFRWASWGFMTVLLIGTIFVVGNSIRSSIAQRHEEITIMELFGATKSMIQVPFIFEGAVLGLFSSLISLVIVYFLFVWQAQVFSESVGFWGLGATMEFLSYGKVVGIFTIGTSCGAFGSYLCVNRFNRGWAASRNMEL